MAHPHGLSEQTRYPLLTPLPIPLSNDCCKLNSTFRDEHGGMHTLYCTAVFLYMMQHLSRLHCRVPLVALTPARPFYPQQAVGHSSSFVSSTTLPSPNVIQSQKNFPIPVPTMIEMIMYPLKYIASSMRIYAVPKVSMWSIALMSCCRAVARMGRDVGAALDKARASRAAASCLMA